MFTHSQEQKDALEQPGGSGPAASYVATLYLPPEHIEHTPPLTPENPFLHRHAVLVILPAAEIEFSGQGEQSSLETSCLNVPLSHGVHVPSAVFVKPASHTQSLNLLLPIGEVA